MKNEIMDRIRAVNAALNAIEVKGKTNLANLSGSIAILEEVAEALNQAEFHEPAKSEAQPS